MKVGTKTMSLYIYMESLGCSKNQIDAEIMLGLLNNDGYILVSDRLDADVIIINTCGFIESAKQESIDIILEMAELKKDKLRLLIVTGCLAERYEKELAIEIPEIDAMVGTGNYHEIIDIINKSMTGKKIIRTGNINKNYDEDLPRFYKENSHTNYIKISDGCSNLCTYCIIPKLRGRYRSRRMEKIVEEAKILAGSGTKEIILIAQDTTRYGIDIYGKYMLADLLDQLNKIDGIRWIRLLYCYPEAITDDLIEAINRLDKVCKYIDMPIQHCSDIILKRMNRRTNKDKLYNLIKKLRNRIPDIVIRTTLIVGFPGETEENFLELKKFVQDVQFDKLGVFTYSQEENTPAAKMPDQIGEQIKILRQKLLMETQKHISLVKNRQKIGKNLKVMVEERLTECGEYIGRTSGDSPEIDGLVYIRSKTPLRIGEFVTVKIKDALEYDLIGEKENESGK